MMKPGQSSKNEKIKMLNTTTCFFFEKGQTDLNCHVARTMLKKSADMIVTTNKNVFMGI